MPLQSIKRTPIPGVDLNRGLKKGKHYREEWPQLRLKKPTSLPGSAKNVRVAIVDSGVPRGTAPDRDDDGHATLLEATILADATDLPVNIEIRATKAFTAQGWPKADGGASAIVDAAKLNPKVIVLAWDTGNDSPSLRKAVSDVSDTAVVVIAAGNWGLDIDKHPNWPASYGEMDHVITVMATDENDDRATYSNWGKDHVYIAAPGFTMVDAVGSAAKGTLRTHGSLRKSLCKFNGTSAATAHVASLAALLYAEYPQAKPKAIKAHIGKTCRLLDALLKPELLCVTHGIVDFQKALTEPL